MRALVLARDGKAMIALGNFGAEGAEGPEIEAGPSLEEYDAQQLGKASAPVPAAPAARRDKADSYTIRFALDLAALGLAENAQARDVELSAGRVKSPNPLAGRPAVPGPGAGMTGAADGWPALRLEEEPGPIRRVAPGVFEMTIAHHDFALIVVE